MADPEGEIQKILNGRDLVPGPVISQCFKVKTGKGIGPHKFIAWRSRKNHIPFVAEGHRILYSWPEVWDWYLIEFAGKRNRAA